jgi:hypothetical protein
VRHSVSGGRIHTDVYLKVTVGEVLGTDHDYVNILDLTSNISLLSKGRLIPIKDPNELKDYDFIPMKAVLKPFEGTSGPE